MNQAQASCMDRILYWLYGIGRFAFLDPLRGLYRNGPAFQGYGFWAGAEDADVCAQLTNVPSNLWRSTPEQITHCENLIERHFMSFAWLIFIGMYILFIYKVVVQLWFRYCVLRPAAREFARAYLAIRDGGAEAVAQPKAIDFLAKPTHRRRATTRPKPKPLFLD